MSAETGEQLRQARQARNLSLEQAAQATHVRLHYLRALEEGDFAALPSLAQARGFVRIYAGYLGLDDAPLLASLAETPRAAALPAAPVEDAPAETDDSRAIFADIGARLQNQRQLLGLSFNDVERFTHLRQHYLKALESGDLERLPSPTQGRGMLSNYAEFLGMDPEPLLLRFAEALQSQLAVRHAARPPAPPRSEQPVRPPGRLARLFSPEMLLVIFTILFLVGFAAWAAIRIYSMQPSGDATPTAPSISSVLLLPPTATATPTPPPATPTLQPAPTEALVFPDAGSQPTPAPGGQNQVQVYVTIRQRAWLRVTVDGEVQFEGRVLPGTAYQYVGEQSVELLTGNAAAIQVFFNQQDLGLLGFFGQVVTRIYTLDGVLLPTPTQTLPPSPAPLTTPAGATSP